MRLRKLLLPTKRAQIIALKNQNFSTRFNAKKLWLKESIVVRTLQRFDGSDRSLHDRPKSGRPRKSTFADDQHLLLLSTKIDFACYGASTALKTDGRSFGSCHDNLPASFWVRVIPLIGYELTTSKSVNVGRRRWLTFEVGQIVADRGKIFLFCSPVQSSLEP